MFRKNLIVAVRKLWKNKLYMVTNVFGLSIGMTAALVIWLIVHYQYSFDNFEAGGDRIYRMVSEMSFSGNIFYNPGVSYPMGDAVRREMNGLDGVMSFYVWDEVGEIAVPRDNQSNRSVFKNRGDVILTGADFLDFIGYTWLAGDRHTGLSQPFTVVVTVAKAKVYFPGLQLSEIMGRTIYLSDTIPYRITGIVADIREQSVLTFNTFVSRASVSGGGFAESLNDWGNINGSSQVFVKVAKGRSPEEVAVLLNAIFARHHHAAPGDNSTTMVVLQPLSDLHFNQQYYSFRTPSANRSILNGLLAVAAFLLTLGCINFINLSTAFGARRAKEIGVRKCLGSSRWHLVRQFFSETFILVFFAAVISIAMVPLIIHLFSDFMPPGLTFGYFSHPGIFLILLLLLIGLTLIAGFYPALVLSNGRIVSILKDQPLFDGRTSKAVALRKFLTVFQFAVAQLLVLCTIFVSRQLTFLTHKDQGFSKDGIVSMYTPDSDTSTVKRARLVAQLKAMPAVALVSLCNHPPSSLNAVSAEIKYNGGRSPIETDVQLKVGDSNYVRLYGIRLLAGTNLATTDTARSFVINETYCHILGFQHAQDAIGKVLWRGAKGIPITGVVRDFNQGSLHDPVKPLVIFSKSAAEFNVSVKLRTIQGPTTGWPAAMEQIRKIWSGVYPNDQLEYTFFDDDLAGYYSGERNLSFLVVWATGLAVVISCLGLLGLVMHTINQRTKEISLRKVFGASVTDTMRIILWEFLVLVLVAFLIALPLAWYGLNKWLDNFAFRTPLEWWLFITGLAIMLLVAVVSIGYQTIKIALSPPTVSLRAE
jgi:putative ABC transport system permease protein